MIVIYVIVVIAVTGRRTFGRQTTVINAAATEP